MRDFDVRSVRFNRDQLPEIFQGTLKAQELSSLKQLAARATIDGTLMAIWGGLNAGLNHLPNIILGSRDALNDLCAWSKAYMTGVGPLSGLMRLVSLDQLAELLELPEQSEPIDIEVAGEQVAIILAEVAARSGDVSAIDRIGLKACLNTLSYSMFRSLNRGIKIDADLLSDRWSSLRSAGHLVNAEKINLAIIMACFYSKNFGKPLFSDTSAGLKFPYFDKYSAQNSFSYENSVDARIVKILNDPELGRRPREDLVHLIDTLIHGRDQKRRQSPSENLMLAKLIAQTTRGLSNQFSLIRDVSISNPELVIALGLAQQAIPAPEILSSFNGVGWKLLSRLTEPFDIFKRPDCDLAFEESQIFNLDHRSNGLNERGNLRVEIIMGTSVEAVSEKANHRDQAYMERDRYYREQRKHSQQAFDFLESRLIELIDVTRRMKNEKNGR